MISFLISLSIFCDSNYSLSTSHFKHDSRSVKSSETICLKPTDNYLVLFNLFEGFSFNVINESGEIIETAPTDERVFGFLFKDSHRNCILAVTNTASDNATKKLSFTYEYSDYEFTWIVNTNWSFVRSKYDGFPSNDLKADTSIFFFGEVDKSLNVTFSNFEIYSQIGEVITSDGNSTKLYDYAYKEMQFDDQVNLKIAKRTYYQVTGYFDGTLTFTADTIPYFPVQGILKRFSNGFLTKNEIMPEKMDSEKKAGYWFIVLIIIAIIIVILAIVYFFFRFRKHGKNDIQTDELDINLA